MGNKKVEDKKVLKTFRIRKSLLEQFTKEKGYNLILEKLIEDYLKSKKNSNNSE